jgi:hypothetical protein
MPVFYDEATWSTECSLSLAFKFDLPKELLSDCLFSEKMILYIQFFFKKCFLGGR